MNDFSVGMALVDFIPVALFVVSAVILQRDLYNKMSKGAFALFAAGTIDIMLAGGLKAVWKLLYAANVCDFTALNNMFFPVQAIGFLLSGLGVVALLTHKQGEGMYAILPFGLITMEVGDLTGFVNGMPNQFSGTMIFVVLMILGVIAMDAGLSVIAKRMGKPLAILFFVIAVIGALMMGYLSSRDSASALINWAAEGVNVLGQAGLLAGTWYLHKNGLKEFEIKK